METLKTKVENQNKIKCKVVMLPTQKKRQIGQKHLYLTSREKIHEGDWVMIRGWRTRPIIKYLREHGFVVIELVKQTILNTHWTQFPLKPEHCLLINCQMDNKENSMVIAHKGAIWHNYEEEKNPSLFFLNKPSQDCLLVYHPKWKAKKPFKNIKTIKQLAAISSRISVQK